MARNVLSASSTSSTRIMPARRTFNPSDFSIWSMIQRNTSENAFCLTSKYRVNARIARIRNDVITRSRRPTVDERKDNEYESGSSSSSDMSDDWDNLDDLDDVFDVYDAFKTSGDGGLITNTRIGSSFGIDGETLIGVASNGSRAQKVYLKKCGDFLITPSRVFLKALNLAHIDIGHQNIGPRGAEACAIALTQTTTVITLAMDDNAIGHKGAKYIAFMLKDCKNIKELNLADNNICGRGVKYIAQVIIEYDRIQRLDLANNGFKEDDASIFKLMLEETRNLRYLNLSHNTFRERGGELLGEGLSYNDGLEELDVGWNHLRRAGAVGLAEGLLDNTSLKTVTLAWNGLSLEGCLALQRTLTYNTTLEVLDLTNNRINRECIDQLTRGLAKNTTLHTLILKFNPLTLDGAYDILQFINECPTSGITKLDLGIQQVEPKFLTMIKEVHLQGRELSVIYGHVIGQMTEKSMEYEQNLIEHHPALILIEFGKIMGFRLMDLFTSLDKDGSRTLSKDEIITGLKMANIPFSDACTEKLITKLDIDGDGEIDFTELLVAQQDYREELRKYLEAKDGLSGVKVEDTKLWRIRVLLQKLMAEKMSDFAAFKRLTEEIVRRIQSAKDEADTKRAADSREHNRRLLQRKESRNSNLGPEQSKTALERLPEEKSEEDIETPRKAGGSQENRAAQNPRAPLAELEADDRIKQTRRAISNVSEMLDDADDDFKEVDIDKYVTAYKRNSDKTKQGKLRDSMLVSKDVSHTEALTSLCSKHDNVISGDSRCVDSDGEKTPEGITSSVSTSSKTFRRNTLGTLQVKNTSKATAGRRGSTNN